MKNLHSVFLLLVLAVNVAFGSSPTGESASQPPVLPDFILSDLSGERVSLSDFDGDAKLIVFWATWCPYCKKLLPEIQVIHARYQSHGLTTIAISIFDSGDKAAHVEQYGLGMTVLVDGDELAEAIGIPGTPTVLLLNSRNQVVFAAVNPGANNSEFKRALNSVLEARQD